MRIIIWPTKPKAWEYDHEGGYRAGDLRSYDGQEWVCVCDHRMARFAPGMSTVPFWVRVIR